MFNDITHPVIAFGLFVLLLLVLYVVGRMTGVIVSHEELPDQTELDDEDYDDDDDDDYPRDIEDVPLPDDTLTGRDHIAVLEMRRMKLRAECPRLYSDTWYKDTRADFSQWAVEQYQLQSEHRKEMGLAA